jgi:aminoglycoside 6'-N-acetyltransferase
LNELTGTLVTLRTAAVTDVDALFAIRATPEVHERWRGDDVRSEILEAIADDDLQLFVVEDGTGTVIGGIQWAAESDPEYAHASVDLFLDPKVHSRGCGSDAARTLCRYLINVEGFHRITIDPAADNVAAIRCYEKVGFRRVGIMRAYERGLDGSWHDGLLMDLLAEDLK